MKPKPLNRLLAGCAVRQVTGSTAGVCVGAITDDSRQAGAGSLFVAVRGTQQDGHRFCADAVRRGATVLVVEKKVTPPPARGVVTVRVADARKALERLATVFYEEPARRMSCVGVTGTNGKTTTAYLVQSVLRASGRRCGLLGTTGYDAGAGLVRMNNTTPGLAELYAILQRMVRTRCTHVVMEVSSHALDQERVKGLVFRQAVFTNLTRDHLDYHKTMARYFAAKKMLFQKYVDASSTRIINIDDAYGSRLKKTGKGRLLTYGLSADADIRGTIERTGWEGSRLRVYAPQGRMDLATPLVGRHNAFNVLAAVAVAVAEGVSEAAIRSGIKACGSVPGRLERVKNERGLHVFVDYAHTDDALKNVLESLRRIPHNGNIITVFGCGGDRDRGKRPRMGRAVSRLSDYTIVTSDNPRTEDPQAIIQAILKGVVGGSWEVVPDRRRAIGRALSKARPGDVVLIAGKGHEAYQIVGSNVIPFDDRAVAAAFLQTLRDV